jgi:hypothetical protein
MKLFVIHGVPKAYMTDFTSCTVSAPPCELRNSVGISAELTIIKAAGSYWQETTGNNFYHLPGTAWIRLSTGKLCMDLGSGYESIIASIHHVPVLLSKLPEVKLTENDLGDKLLSTLELDEFYSLLACDMIGIPKFLSSTPGTIMLPSIDNPHWDRAHSKPNDLHAILTEKHLTLDDLYIGSWYNVYESDLPQEVLPTGWTQCAYGCFSPSFSNNCSIEWIIQIVLMEPYIWTFE